jgi:hypothetical protein
MTVKFSHERNVRSLAKKTLGSTRVGRAIFLPVVWVSSGAPTAVERGVESKELRELSCLVDGFGFGPAYLEQSGGEVDSTSQEKEVPN